MAFRWLSTVGALAMTAVVAGCGSDEGNASNGPAGRTEGTLWVLSSLWAQAVDLATGEPASDIVQVVESSSSVYTMVASGDQLWVGRRDGVVTAVDSSTGKSTEIVVDSDETWGISEIAVGESVVYVGSGSRAASSSAVAPPLVAIDRNTLREKQRKDVFGPAINELFRSMVVDGDTLWTLHENEFELMKIDANTLAVLARLPLAEDFDDPTGPPVAGHGYGHMQLVGDALWVVDQANDRLPLWRVDAATLTPSRVMDLSDEFGALARDCVRMTSNRTSFFVLFCDPSIDQVARFDGKTGALEDVYELQSVGPNALVASESTLYLDSEHSASNIIGIDLRSAEQRVVYTDTNSIRLFTIRR